MMNLLAVRFALVLGLAAVLAEIQPPRSSLISVTVSDIAGHRHVVTIGAHTAATDTLDPVLGELPVPPVPFEGAFDVRLLGPPEKGKTAGADLYRDLRPLTSAAQIDTFVLGFRTATDSYPLSFSLPDTVAQLCDSIGVYLELPGKLEKVGLIRGTWEVVDPGVDRALIIRHGVR